MLEAAVRGLRAGGGAAETGVLGVSVLTSLSAVDLERLGIQRTPGQLVGKMAKVALSAGCEGLVCAPQELHVVGQAAPGLMRVTPGIRPESVDDDQTRVSTPADAVRKGADWLVVGRPITAAPDPVAAAISIARAVREAEGALG